MSEKKLSQEFREKNIDETRNYFTEEINHNEKIIKKRKKICMVLSYSERLLMLASADTECISISVFACLVRIPLAITSSSVRVEVCAITAGIKNYKIIIK